MASGFSTYDDPSDFERIDFEAEGDRIARRAVDAGRLSLTCPTCHMPGVLSPREASRGYQCTRCADLDEGAF